MNQLEAFNTLRAQGKSRGQAVRAIAYATYGADSAEAKSFMAGWRASLKYADNLEAHESTHAAQYGARRGNAFTDGWILAASV